MRETDLFSEIDIADAPVFLKNGDDAFVEFIHMSAAKFLRVFSVTAKKENYFACEKLKSK